MAKAHTKEIDFGLLTGDKYRGFSPIHLGRFSRCKPERHINLREFRFHFGDDPTDRRFTACKTLFIPKAFINPAGRVSLFARGFPIMFKTALNEGSDALSNYRAASY
ncbi:hypothetical protein [Desulforamulus ferrireducens]|uniref:hypothetical protein n=1 Tax=Desulforamulus ferrireducens TaxID=1833852 RepID=UPI001EE41946|nr:hypothetical protein [Desulforamulus ferrireducens]